MISRLPNTLASIENAPGPRMTIARSMVPAKAIATFESNTVAMDAGRTDSQMASAPKATIPPATGVRKPINSIAPHKIAKAPVVNIEAVVFDADR